MADDVPEPPESSGHRGALLNLEGWQMTADYYFADTESGDHIDDPSEDALLTLIECLDRRNSWFVRIRSAPNREPARASVTRTAAGYLVERQGAGWVALMWR
jgi:hypothetical protein